MLLFTKKGLILQNEKIIVVTELRDNFKFEDLTNVFMVHSCTLECHPKADRAEQYALSRFRESQHNQAVFDIKDPHAYKQFVCENEFVPSPE